MKKDRDIGLELPERIGGSGKRSSGNSSSAIAPNRTASFFARAAIAAQYNPEYLQKTGLVVMP